MSDSILRIIPQQPALRPPVDVQQAALSTLRGAFGEAEDISARDTEEIAFIDAGENFETIYCRLCDEEIDQDWWGEAMEHAAATEFADLTVKTPCCQGSTNLNDLRYETPQGFARFVLEVLNPNATTVPDVVVEELRKLLGCELQFIWARY